MVKEIGMFPRAMGSWGSAAIGVGGSRVLVVALVLLHGEQRIKGG